ncbi:formyltransferase family protein [Maricaulis sp.]|uniref:formyltransferase family protein n=1 Tax=Maricaulis sp. TaxID=1486257 RepID=UPI001B1941C4|nr:formyltransferase family protein [Maricaulis sp.]MBO6796521.1 hypothetical protein [Maricaulis sp.]
MRLGILTYDTQHLKTEQVVSGLQIAGSYEYVFYALPFISRPGRDVALAHRPVQSNGGHAREIAASVDAPYTVIESADDIHDESIDFWIIAGSNLLPAGFVGRYRNKIINGHAGLIPSVRGLDSFKWAILDGQPVGNTLHFIDEEADAGEVIASQLTPIYSTDTLAEFARRHYEIEIAMLSNFERLVSEKPRVKIDLPLRPARMRMKREIEEQMIDSFEAYRDRFAGAAAAEA